MLTRIAWACVPAFASMCMAGCGSKGDLVLPKAAAAAPAAATPARAPSATSVAPAAPAAPAAAPAAPAPVKQP